MRVGDEEVLHDVLFARRHADQALAAAPLLPVFVERRALDVARARRRDDDVFVGDQVLDPELAAVLDDLGPAVVAVLRLDGAQLVDDDGHHQVVARQDAAQPLDGLHQLGQLVQNLLPLEAGEPLQLHVENRLGLDLASGRTASTRPALRFGGFFDPRMSLITASRWSSAILRPSRICARASALRSSNSVRRRTTSRRNSMKCSMTWSRLSTLRAAGRRSPAA